MRAMHLPLAIQEKLNKQDEKIDNLLLLLERLQIKLRELERKNAPSSDSGKVTFHHPAIHFPMESN